MPKSSGSKSTGFYRFFRVIDFEKACPRRMVWYLLEVEGKPQYYYNKMIFDRGKLFEHLLKKFPNASGDTDIGRIDKIFKNKIDDEDANELTKNLDSMVSAYNIKITDINNKLDYPLTNPPIRIYCDGVGTFEGNDALFKFNTTQRFKKDDAYELVLVEHMINPNKKKTYRLISLNFIIRNYLKI